MSDRKVDWSTLKTRQAADGFKLYYKTYEASKNVYDVYGANSRFFMEASVEGTAAGSTGKDFNDSFLAGAIAVSSRDDAYVLALPPLVNQGGIQQVELVAREGRPGFRQWTIASFDYCHKTTWFQNYDQNTDVSLTPDVPGLYDTYKSNIANWICIDDFRVAAQSYNRGSPLFGHDAIWQRDGTRAQRADYRPVIKVNGVVRTSGYTIDFALGKVSFSPALTSTDTVTVTFRTPKTTGGSEFITRPLNTKKFVCPHIELNMSLDVVLNGYTALEIWGGDSSYGCVAGDYYLQYAMEYESVHQIIALSTGKLTRFPAWGGTGVVPVSARTGWSSGQKRGLGAEHIEVIFEFGNPADWGQAMILKSSQYVQIRVRTENDAAHTGEYASVSFYDEEMPE